MTCGGSFLGYKNFLRNGISFIKSHPDYIWCKLNHTFFNLGQDVYLCALYIPPHDSPYFDPELFVNIETDIALFHRKGFIMLAGNFNASTGKANDFIAEENGNFLYLVVTFLHQLIFLKNRTLTTLSTIMENNYLIFVKLAI